MKTIQAFASSDVGQKRSQNQDHFGVFNDLNLYIVADGMGGHQGGETASRISVESISNFIRNNPPLQNPSPDLPIKQLLNSAFQDANQSILKEAIQNPALEGMGTTTVALYLHNSPKNSSTNSPENLLAQIAHVGDSRCYLYRNQKLWQLTRDHSLVQEKLKAGIITREQTKTDKMKNVILRSVGFEAHMEVDFYSMTTEPQDLFLLCSDGLTGQLNDVQISNILSDIHTSSSPLYEITQRLIQAANQSGGEDNITALLVQIL